MNFLKISCILLMILTKTSLYGLTHKPKIAVIGAGLAGLTTAYRLHQKNFDVDVYEARNRVGGRIFSALVNDKAVELGGQNIKDGGDAPSILSLVGELKLELITSLVPFAPHYFSNGVFVPEKNYFNKYSFNADILESQLKDAASKSKNMKEILLNFFSEDDDIYKIASTRLAGYEGNIPEKLSVFYIATLYHILLGGASQAHPMSDRAYNLLTIAGGNSLLPEKLAQELGEHIHLGMILDSVSKSPHGSFLLTFKDGKQSIVDILVLAVPAPVFKNIKFSQGILPQKQLSAIREIEYGINAKILVPISCAQFDNTSYLSERLGIFPDGSGTVLTLYYRGNDATFSSDTIQESYMHGYAMLKAALNVQCLPELSPITALDKSFISYDRPVGHSWPNDPYAGGSYSYIAPGQESLLTTLGEHEGETIKTLFAPIDNRLYFAGEHTSILMDVPGTMEAACESGERAARMIAKALKTIEFDLKKQIVAETNSII